MTRAAVAALLIATAVFVMSSIAHAERTSLVTIVLPPHADSLVGEATTRLEAELRSAGFEVRVVAGTAGADGRAQVEGSSGGGPAPEGSFATIAILATDRGAVADIWVADHVTKKTLVRRIGTSDSGSANGASDLAVRSVELLRASLLEVSAPQKKELPNDLSRWLGQQPPPAPVAVPAPTPAQTAAPATRPAPAQTAAPATRPAPARRPEPSPEKSPPQSDGAASSEPGWAHRMRLEGAFGLLVSPASGVAVVPLVLRLEHALPARFAVRATLAKALVLTKSKTEGSVALGQDLLALDVTYAFTERRARAVPFISLGAGLYHLRVDGSAKPPYVAAHQDVFAAAFAAGGGVELRLLDSVHVVADASALVFQPEPAVTIANAVAFQTGRPAIAISLGVAVGF